MQAGMRVHQGGSGEPLLVLLHGLGATGDIWGCWRPLLARRWPGRWLAPDLPGHGGSPPLAAYSFDSLAAQVAGIVQAGAPVIVLGHSLGGVVGLALASGRYGVAVQAVIGLGIKVTWTGEDLDRAQAAARRPPAWYASREEAAARYLRVSGLDGLLPAGDPAVGAGLREQDGRWQLAMDPAAFTVGAPDMAQLLARSQAPVTLARGEHDPMNTDMQLARLGCDGHAPRPRSQRPRPAPGTGDHPPRPTSTIRQQRQRSPPITVFLIEPGQVDDDRIESLVGAACTALAGHFSVAMTAMETSATDLAVMIRRDSHWPARTARHTPAWQLRPRAGPRRVNSSAVDNCCRGP